MTLAEAMDKAVMDAVSAGKSGEDDSQGHALFTEYPEGRDVQEKIIALAARNLALLRRVLREFRRRRPARHGGSAAGLCARQGGGGR